ncbi:DUF4266 domain-containing protein [Mucilaginibacter endophyticus]|uniref:DUF4266 domain-containing protein n=1 Tax=Mucilaginibacter endophyticus TaxID=2675003 RepID=UPI000E0D38E7|nr:DUF4266 domain-containing protein [Mucilaginibacter endophyticus]
MKKVPLIKLMLIGGLPALGMSSCMSVKAYQKNRLNDAEMELSARKSQKFEQSFQLYREGGSGANGGKSGGGCGCN